MRALVTGAGGFLGRHLVAQLLDQGVSVRTFSRGDYPELRALGVDMQRGDIRDAAAVERACQGMDVVYHTAGVAGIWGKWSHYYEINTVGTENVVAACRRCGVGRLVYSSSPSVTFDGSDQVDVDEHAAYPTRWLCHYPHSKALAEQCVLAATDSSGLQTCAIRPHLIWGPGDPHLIPRLLDRAGRGRLVQIGDGRNLIDMIYVDNAAAAHWQAAQAMEQGRPVAGKAYFVSQGEPVNCWEWINEILRLAGIPPVRGRISHRTAWFAGWMCEWIYTLLRRREEPPMTRFLAAQLATSHYFNIQAARRDFGYSPRISTSEGMERLAQWLENR